MTHKAKLGLAGALVIAAAAAVSIGTLWKMNTLLKQENIEIKSDLLKHSSGFTSVNAIQQPQIENLKAELQQAQAEILRLREQLSSSHAQVPGHAKRREQYRDPNDSMTEKDAAYVRLKRANMKGLSFRALDDSFQLTDQAADVLEITPEE